jgi:hypothetical protein
MGYSRISRRDCERAGWGVGRTLGRNIFGREIPGRDLVERKESMFWEAYLLYPVEGKDVGEYG